MSVLGRADTPVSTSGSTSRLRVQRSVRRRERLVAGAMCLPQLIPFIAFTIAPLIWVLYVGFTHYDGISSPTWAGLDNYRALWHDTQWWHSVRVTLIFGVAKMAIEVPLALAMALLLNATRRFGGFFRTVFFLPHVVSIAVMGVIFYFLFRPVDGVINGVLQAGHLIGGPVDWLGSPWRALGSLVAVGVWSGFGFSTILFLVGLQTIPRELYESASVEGAGSWQRFRFVTVPLLSPVMRVIVVLTIVHTMRSFDLVKTLTDGGPAGNTDVMFTYMFSYYFSSTRGSQFGYSSALSVAASVIIAALSVVYLLMSRDRDARPDGRRRWRRRTGAAAAPAERSVR